eukprot:1153025-Pelagomonas_calceolata.AAC.2
MSSILCYLCVCALLCATIVPVAHCKSMSSTLCYLCVCALLYATIVPVANCKSMSTVPLSGLDIGDLRDVYSQHVADIPSVKPGDP